MKKKFIFLSSVVAMAFVLLFSDIAVGTCSEVCESYRNGSGDKPADYDLICGGCDHGETQLQGTVKSVLSTVFTFVGIIAVVMIIIGGVKYMTSQGDPGKVAAAKNTILFSVIGLTISISAFAIVNFALGAIK